MARKKANSAENTTGDSSTDRKKLRNRLAQQAFRQRQLSHVADLERRLERSGASDNERIAELEAENRSLREQLNTFISKLSSAQVALQDLSHLMQGAVGEKSAGKKKDRASSGDVPSPQEREASTDLLPSNHILPATEVTDQSWDFFQDMEAVTADDNNFSAEWMSAFENVSTKPQPAPEPLDDSRPGDMPMDGSLTLYDGVPGVWQYSYQTGPAAYAHAIACSPSLGRTGVASNSTFSDHLSALRRCMQGKLKEPGLGIRPNINSWKLQQSISMMFCMFNGLTRPVAMSWYTPTKWYNRLSGLATWQIHPTQETYSLVHPSYRPTGLQISEAYPTFIDWCPFPALRDQLILTHAANPKLDDILLDLASSYCMETDLSALVRTLPRPTPGYVRVWDIIQCMGDDGAEQAGHTAAPYSGSSPLPAPDAPSFFASPSYALQTFRLLGMNEGKQEWKLDPAIFSKYPELYAPGLLPSMAAGTLLRCESQQLLPQIPPPVRLDDATLKLYRHFADWALNVIYKYRPDGACGWDLPSAGLLKFDDFAAGGRGAEGMF